MLYLYNIGRYAEMLYRVFSKPEQRVLYRKQTAKEVIKIGYSSINIVLIISFFFGAVITLQTANNMDNPLLPNYLIGLGTRDTILLEFASTIMCLILAGKVGSNIASEIGTMRVTEQIDALEVMGVNSASYLILPKIIAAILTFPFLSLISMIIGIVGGWFAGISTGEVSTTEYVYGIQYVFIPYYIVYSLIKVFFNGFLIITISSYFGYYTEGGALEVGRSSTKAVVNSSLMILVMNLVLTQLLL
jgi:phospholipid/cholesterol/gamma-HCH transport system permease protein